jgi:NADH:ubiquinone oxidoreductase subunit F (NADH-binding)
MTIAALRLAQAKATYIRGEYKLAYHRSKMLSSRRVHTGLLGQNIFGKALTSTSISTPGQALHLR